MRAASLRILVMAAVAATATAAQAQLPWLPHPGPAAPAPEAPPAPMQVAQAPSAAQQRDVRLIKTAYLYNFLKFVRWPDGGTRDIVVCIARDADLARLAQNALRDKRVAERAVQIVGIEPGPAPPVCDLRYAPVGPVLVGGPTLTVGEGRAFVEAGGMIAFAIADDRVRFYVNLKALREAGLSADARLLAVAIEVLQ